MAQFDMQKMDINKLKSFKVTNSKDENLVDGFSDGSGVCGFEVVLIIVKMILVMMVLKMLSMMMVLMMMMMMLVLVLLKVVIRMVMVRWYD